MPPKTSKHWVPTLCTVLGCRDLKTQIKKGWVPQVWLAGLPSSQTQASRHWAPAGYPVLSDPGTSMALRLWEL